jgi:hypothetical protein
MAFPEGVTMDPDKLMALLEIPQQRQLVFEIICCSLDMLPE